MVTLLIPLIVKEQGGTASLAGALSAFYAFIQFFSGPIIGMLSDRFGRKPVLLMCMLGTAFAFLMLGTASGLIWVMVAVMLDGLTGGNLTTAYAYIADITTAQNRARGMGMVGAAFGLGMMIGPALSGTLSQYAMQLPVLFAAGLALCNVIFGWLFLPESLSPALRISRMSWHSLNPFRQLFNINHLGQIRALLVAMLLLNLAFSGLQTNFPLYAQARFRWSAYQVGVFFAFVGICAVFVQGILIHWLHRHIHESRLALIGILLMCAGLLCVAFIQIDVWLYPIVGLAALGSGVGIPSLSSLTSTRVNPSQQGQLMGVVQSLLSIALILGPLISGIVFDQIGNGAPYAIGALMAFVAFVAAMVGLRTLRISEPDAKA